VLPGPSLNAAVIEGTDGLIVWEAGENVQHGRRYRELIRKISRKPIKAVIYSHTHYTLGTSALLEGEADVPVIGHRRLNENMRLSSAGSYFPEIEPLQRARAIQHAQMPPRGRGATAGSRPLSILERTTLRSPSHIGPDDCRARLGRHPLPDNPDSHVVAIAMFPGMAVVELTAQAAEQSTSRPACWIVLVPNVVEEPR